MQRGDSVPFLVLMAIISSKVKPGIKIAVGSIRKSGVLTYWISKCAIEDAGVYSAGAKSEKFDFIPWNSMGLVKISSSSVAAAIKGDSEVDF